MGGIQLLEYSKTSPSSPSPPSRSGDPPSISGTESRIIDPLVSKRLENFLSMKKNPRKKTSKMHYPIIALLRGSHGLSGRRA